MIVTDVSWYVYVIFIAFVIAMLLVDLKVFHADEHEPKFNESLVWFFVWFGLGVIFGLGLWVYYDGRIAGEYFAGFLVEKSLSVDNLFVFVLIFSYFQVPFIYQHQVLFYGILGALIFRGIFIAAGVGLINTFDWIVYIFGAFLILTAIRIAFGSEEVHPEQNPVLKFAQKRLASTPRYDGQNLFTVENGHRVATPLFITLIFIEVTDIIFAVDSIPAILAITTDPFIVLTSNVFAILGLRALYFLLAGSVDRFHLLKYGLAVILGFVGVKMLLEAFHVEVPIALSLSFIIVVLAVTVFLSFKIPPPEKKKGVATFPKRPPPESASGAEKPASEDEEPEAETG